MSADPIQTGNGMFKQVEAVRLSDGAVDQIVAALRTGDLQVGDRIPSERALMRELGIGRASVREALRKLETMGVIDVRPGMGAVVVKELTEATAYQLWKTWITLFAAEAFQLLEVREGFELKAAELAAERITPDQLDTLRHAIVRLEATLPEGDPAERADADIVFHTTLLQASGNKLLIALAESLMYALHEARIGAYQNEARSYRSAAEHTAIFEAISRHDTAAAREAMLEHLTTSKVFILRSEQK